ncbi:hypothetical protein ES705_48396 [subsurface metagenome]
MRFKNATFWLFPVLLYLSTLSVSGANDSIKPVTPDPSPEAVKLLQYIYSISGKHTLTGQHSQPLFGSTKLAAVEKITGYYPAKY